MRYELVRELDSWHALLRQGGDLRGCVIQGLDLSREDFVWEDLQLDGTVFLGCTFPESVSSCRLQDEGTLVFPEMKGVPYRPYRNSLYSREELQEGWSETSDNSLDKRIYDHFMAKGREAPDVLEALAQRLHDHAIDDALRDLLEGRVNGAGPLKVVAVMGGHSTPRTDPYFAEVVRLTCELTRNGYFIASGGGPGIMEAANLGAYLANESDETLEWALGVLSKAPKYDDPGYLQAAQEVIDRVPHGAESVAIPTWFYGHEPTNSFSNRVAKYFSNSLREDGLLAIAVHGVIYAPGSAGTVQEVFMDACQNHYATFHWISPMVFLGEERWGGKSQIFEAAKFLAKGKAYAKSLSLVDTAAEAAAFIRENPPFKV